jgi:hypothetical protein
MRSALVVTTVFLGTVILIGCQTSGGGGTKPTVIVNSPPSGTSFQEGDDVSIQSTATDVQGVTRIELQVDGSTVHSDSSPVQNGQAQFSTVQTWKAAGVGNHTVIVRAYNSSGASSDAGLTLVVKQSVAAALTDTPGITTVVPPPTLTSSPTDTPTATLPPPPQPSNTSTLAPVACTPNSQYVADVTIPDGTPVAAGSAFVKTWQVRNTGTCAWDASFSIAFAGGTPFVIGSAPIPSAAPGEVVNISLSMSAPGTFGAFTGTWRLRGPDGAFFGTKLTTAIVVPNPNPPAATNTLTPTSTNTPMPGAPNIASFTCTPCTIAVGGSATLKWGPVAKATSASIDQGINGISTPGNQTVSPAATTTYTLTANGPGGTSQATVTITVVGNFAGHWDDNFGFMDLTQNGASVSGTFFNAPGGASGNIAGNVSENTLSGTGTYGASGTIQFTLGAGGNTFSGNWNSTEQWCGARTGVSFSNGCGFDGHWNTKYNSGTGTLCSMDLSQVGGTVTGTYCNGTIQKGAISYVPGYVKLSGKAVYPGGTTFDFIFYLPDYKYLQFQGNYGASNDWCGWRNGSSQPSPCEKN